MLELGSTSAELHRGLIEVVNANAIDMIFCCGPLMRNLWDALSSGRRGGYAEGSAALESQVVAAVRAGDVIMVKGSLGSRMKVIVTALEKRFPGNAAHDEGRAPVLELELALQDREVAQYLGDVPTQVGAASDAAPVVAGGASNDGVSSHPRAQRSSRFGS